MPWNPFRRRRSRKRAAPPPPVKMPPPRRPSVEVDAKELKGWAPPPEIVEGPLTPMEIVMAATREAVRTPPPPPPPAAAPALEPAGTVTKVARGRVVHLVLEDGTVVPADETSEAAEFDYLARNILQETRPAS